MSKEKATHQPGGAPLKKAPRKKKAAKAKAPKAAKKAKAPKKPKAKKPCKYGARTADGYCPKKPSAYQTKSPVLDAVLNKKVPGKKGSVGSLTEKALVKGAEKAADEAARKVADKISSHITKNPDAIEKAVKTVGGAVVGLGAFTIPALIAWLLGRAVNKQTDTLAAQYAARLMTDTKKRLGKQRLTPEQEKTLLAQYYSWSWGNINAEKIKAQQQRQDQFGT